MPESQETPKKHPRKKKGSLFLPVIITIVFFAAIISIWFLFFKSPQIDERSTPIVQKQQTLTETVEPVPPSQPVIIKKTASSLKTTDTALPELPAVPSSPGKTLKPQANIIETKQKTNCQELASRLNIFFTQVDQKEYIQTFKLKESSQTYFLKLVDKLLENPPVVVREADDLFTILRNMAHFFRVIGRTNILLIKTVLDREAEKVEDIAKELYLFVITAKCDQEIFPLAAPVEKIYEYAGFFINTMGGRSYLFRRDSRSRLLINYYSILIIDLANKDSMNQYGIEIKQSISQLINEIESTTQLIYKESYLDKLYELSETYPVTP